MKTNKRIKIITNSGFKYEGEFISEEGLFIILKDDRQGRIKVPIQNISFIKEEENNEKRINE
jgi:hypothetical protein